MGLLTVAVIVVGNCGDCVCFEFWLVIVVMVVETRCFDGVDLMVLIMV